MLNFDLVLERVGKTSLLHIVDIYLDLCVCIRVNHALIDYNINGSLFGV